MVKAYNLLFHINFWCCSMPRHMGPWSLAGSVLAAECSVWGSAVIWGLGYIFSQGSQTSEGLTLKVSEVAQSCSTLCDPVDSSPPGSSIHGILQSRILEWVTISFSRKPF